ncbi:MAG TPA: heat-inducible transcription repressor HrcA, partial [Chloroflexi bacterium]|nr:heat-inducible transcription repressor HrcA [Chloroflexota bacterium]
KLTRRQEYILGLIVREYVKKPLPVSSKALVERYRLNVSSATVRNDMAALEELGLITAPHTSAGRIPTEAGYRLFVQRLINDTELSLAEQRTIRHQFHQARADLEEWLRLAASILAHTAHTASVVTAPKTQRARFKHLELIHTHGRLVLMVLVLEGGDVRQQMLTLAEPVSQEKLSEAADRINGQCLGLNAAEIRAGAIHQPTLDQEIMELAADLIEQAEQHHLRIYSDGLVNILDPDHLLTQLQIADPQKREELARMLAEVDSEGARQTLHLLEEQSLLEEVLTEALAPDIQGVQVVIAGEGRWDELSQTSMVLSRYGIFGQTTGALGVLGPIRLHYGRAISAVRYVAGLMSDMLIDLYGEGE